MIGVTVFVMRILAMTGWSSEVLDCSVDIYGPGVRLNDAGTLPSNPVRRLKKGPRKGVVTQGHGDRAAMVSTTLVALAPSDPNG